MRETNFLHFVSKLFLFLSLDQAKRPEQFLVLYILLLNTIIVIIIIIIIIIITIIIIIHTIIILSLS